MGAYEKAEEALQLARARQARGWADNTQNAETSALVGIGQALLALNDTLREIRDHALGLIA
jgi:hypothetical protein